MLAALKEHGDYESAARALGLPYSTFQGRVYTARRKAARGVVAAPPIPDVGKPPEGFAVFRNSAQYDADGNVKKQWVATKRDSGDVFEVPAGHVVKGESALVDPDGRVLARWIKTKEGGGAGLVEGLREAFAEYEGRASVITPPDVSDDDLLTVYPIPDLHFGMLAWSKETGASYDIDIAERIARESLATLVASSPPSQNAVVLFLGDTLHSNDQTNATPRSKHQLDMDGRFARVYRACAELAVDIVEMVGQKHASVEVVSLPGNHDPDAAVTLGVALSLFFRRCPSVNVNLTPGVFWYRLFGRCLFGANHGHTVRKPEDMVMAMANDRSEQWGQSWFRYIFSGHLHHTKVKDIAGVRVETLPSPAPRDSYNTASGYRASRSLSAITYHRERGRFHEQIVNLVSPSSEAA